MLLVKVVVIVVVIGVAVRLCACPKFYFKECCRQGVDADLSSPDTEEKQVQVLNISRMYNYLRKRYW